MRVRSMILYAALFVSALASAVSAEAASTLSTYRNARFGYAVDVPSEFRMGEAPVNNDGRVFYDPSSEGVISVFGMYNALGASRESYATEREEDWRGLGGTVTYRAKRENWFVLSGTVGGDIFYERVIFSADGDTIATLLVRYPQSEKARFDPLVARASRTLRFLRAE